MADMATIHTRRIRLQCSVSALCMLRDRMPSVQIPVMAMARRTYAIRFTPFCLDFLMIRARASTIRYMQNSRGMPMVTAQSMLLLIQSSSSINRDEAMNPDKRRGTVLACRNTIREMCMTRARPTVMVYFYQVIFLLMIRSMTVEVRMPATNTIRDRSQKTFLFWTFEST